MKFNIQHRPRKYSILIVRVASAKTRRTKKEYKRKFCANFIGQICVVDETEESWLKRIRNEVFLADVALNSEASHAVYAWMKGELSEINCIEEVINTTFVEA